MKKILFFIYGVICYALFFATFTYAIAWVGNIGVSQTIDGLPQVSFGQALLINISLLGLFAIQHSGMARPTFKRWWTKFMPEPIERSTYVLLASVALLILFHKWEPMGGIVWAIQDPIGSAILYGIFGIGWALVLVATLQINHFDLFGLRQVWLYLRGREYTPLGFRTPWFYQHVRHPLYLGFVLGFWATPTMTVAHLVFALVTTVYILVAIQLEERNLVEFHGQSYVDYRSRVPMLIPSLAKKDSVREKIQAAPTVTV